MHITVKNLLDIENNIKLQITPVNEDLYFTWQNPPVPPVE